MARVMVSVVPVAAVEAALALANVWVLPVLPRAAAARATVWVPPCRSYPSTRLLPSYELPYSCCRSCPTGPLLPVRALSSSERAVALLEQVPPDISLDAEYHEIYAVALQMTEQFEAASLVYEVLLQLDDRNANWWMGLAMSRDAVGDFEEAESAYAMASHFGARHLLLNRYGEARLSALRGSP